MGKAQPPGSGSRVDNPQDVEVTGDLPLTATGALVWNSDLPRPLQQILFDTADGATPPPESLTPGRPFTAN
ncbi:MAG TPA: hypothetical protein VNO25_16255 [Streptosporangiaceae bacterium]|nr:hypothetical protein [Streptosporangiaceae bacterium]